jgi:hypothetical protein
MFNRYNHPTMAWMLDYWPATILLPTVLLLLAVLALITRWWDQKDDAAAQQTGRLAPTPLPARPMVSDRTAG